MASTDSIEVKWAPDVEDDDYEAARAYLRLVRAPAEVEKALLRLKATPVEQYKVTDLFRAARVELPAKDDRPCRKEIKKIRKGEVIAPVLLLRDPAHSTVIIADGYHRICAAFRIDPDVIIHCKLA